MAIAPNQNILNYQNTPLDLGSLKNKFKKTATCIPFVGDLLGLPIQAKLARLETDSSNFYHKREILLQSLDYDFLSFGRSLVTSLSIPWLLSLAPASPLIMIGVIGSSILLNNIFIFGDLEQRFGKYSAIAKIFLFAINCSALYPPLHLFFLTKNIQFLTDTIVLGQAVLFFTKFLLFQMKGIQYNSVDRDVQNFEFNNLGQWTNYDLNTGAGGIVQNALEILGSLGLNDDDSRTVLRFVTKILRTADFQNLRRAIRVHDAAVLNQNIYVDYQHRVSTIMNNLRDFEEFRGPAIAQMADALNACGDRVASALNTLDMLSYIYGEFKPNNDIDSAFLAIRLVRLDHIRQKAYEHNPGFEGLETQLFLEVALKDRLQLPLQTQNMNYEAIGRGEMTRDTLDQITQEILALTSTDQQVFNILTDSCVWTDRLKHHFADFYEDVMRGFEISARGGGLDYAKNLANFSENPTEEWTEFLGQISPDHSQEVMQTLQEICPSLSGQDYHSALNGPNGLIQQINRKKTIEWSTANGGALRTKLN